MLIYYTFRVEMSTYEIEFLHITCKNDMTFFDNIN